MLADYELLQPFAQLGRDTHRLSEARWLHHKVPTGKVMGLTSRGWQRGAAQDGGWVGTMARALPGGLWAELSLDPGMSVSDISWEPVQTLGEVKLRRLGNWNVIVPWSQLDELAASELLRDMAQLTADS